MAGAGARGRGLHPRLLAQVLEPQPLSPRERVPARERDVHRVLEQLDAAQPGAEPLADAAELEQQREVELAGAQARHDLLRLALGEAQLDLGCAARKVAIASGISVAPAVGNEAIRSRPPRTPAIAASSASAASRRARIAVRVLDERGAGGGRAHAPAVALDQRHARLGLERGDGLRDRRLRVGERLGGRGEGAARGHLAEHPQALHVQH